MKALSLLLLAPILLGAAPAVDKDTGHMLEHISAASMKGHLSFLSSDMLEGRGTPSRGLDLAAEYIAAQFRRFGLEPAGDDGYFQTAMYKGRREGDVETKVHNVIGILRGSDPKLKDTYLLITAHYDHLGMRTTGDGDRIFNGANDDGSGTVSVIEIADAMSRLPKRPKRSIVFMTFYGEERGLVGSRYYGSHPILPLDKTIADVNLEQVGRTDDSEGPRVSAVAMTGYGYSNMTDAFEAAGKVAGVAIQKHPRFSDAYFGASDNQALADQGVPAHTVCTAFSYPDYHQVGDSWDKVDYDNMAKVDRMVALAILSLANSDQEPKWDEKNPKAARYLAAWKKMHEGK